MNNLNKYKEIKKMKTMYINTNYELKDKPTDEYVIEARVEETSNTVIFNINSMCHEFGNSIFKMLEKVYKNKEIKLGFKANIPLKFFTYRAFLNVESRKTNTNKDKIKKLIEDNYIKYESAIQKYANEYMEYVNKYKEKGIHEEYKTHCEISRYGKASDIADFLIDQANDVFFKIETDDESFFIAVFIGDLLDDFYFDNVDDYVNDVTFGCHLLYEYNLSDGSLSKL